MTLVFHQAALGDFALILPLLRSLPAPVTLVASWSRGRLAQALVDGLQTADIDQFEFTRLHAQGGPSTLSPAISDLFNDVTQVIDFVGQPDDAWTTNLQRLTPEATYVALPTRPSPNATLEHLTALHRRLLSDANITLAPLAHPTSHAAPTSGPIVIHPGSGSRDKCWPAEHYHALTTTLRDAGHTIQPVFGEAEAQHWTDDERQRWLDAGAHGLASLEALIEALLPAALYIGNDTGPTHLAAQIGVPTLALFGPTDPPTWAPLGANVTVLTPPSPTSMNWLTPSVVEHQAIALLTPHNG